MYIVIYKIGIILFLIICIMYILFDSFKLVIILESYVEY